MKTHKAAVVRCLLSALFLGVCSGAVLVVQTVETYSGACDKLNGFPGVMQKAGFLPEGNCESRPHVRDDCRRHTCQVNGRAGHCVAETLPKTNPDSDKDFICVCKPNRPSR